MQKIGQLTTELTFRCNAKCPACHRVKPLSIDLNNKQYTITLERFKQLFNPELLRNLEWLVLNGNFGDSIMNKEFREILAYVKEHDVKFNIHTNGGIHNIDYWKDIGNILDKFDIINFDLDGLEDTHHIYRINTEFEKVFENARAVISTKRPQVHWKYIVFEHNKHQVEKARELAIEEGFTTFSTVKTSREFGRPTSGKFVHAKKTDQYGKAEKKIHCIWEDWDKWYISPEGLVFRCCWTGGHYYDSDNSRFYYPPDFEKKFNGFNVPIQKIISYNYWNKLSLFLQGYDRAFSLCKSQCGKLLSIREKIEENLGTGEKTYFDAFNQLGN